MTQKAQEILETLEQLPEEEKRSVVFEILRRTATDTYPPLTDDDLVFAADQVFLELDRDEDLE